ncbi:Agamous-like MADS-box protein AGL1, partial [Cucurbita argyrosperma subsp. argyrosperma]
HTLHQNLIPLFCWCSSLKVELTQISATEFPSQAGEGSASSHKKMGRAYELSVLCDAEVALIVFSTRGRLYEYANNSVRGTIERYKKAFADSSNSGLSVAEANVQFYQQEASKLKRQIREIQNSNRHILGEALSSLSLKDLKSLEGRLERGISKVRAKKEMELQNHNNYLRAQIAEHERIQQQQQQQQTNMMQRGTYETVGGGQYEENRSYGGVGLMDSDTHYAHQDHLTALQLV